MRPWQDLATHLPAVARALRQVPDLVTLHQKSLPEGLLGVTRFVDRPAPRWVLAVRRRLHRTPWRYQVTLAHEALHVLYGRRSPRWPYPPLRHVRSIVARYAPNHVYATWPEGIDPIVLEDAAHEALELLAQHVAAAARRRRGLAPATPASGPPFPRPARGAFGLH